MKARGHRGWFIAAPAHTGALRGGKLNLDGAACNPEIGLCAPCNRREGPGEPITPRCVVLSDGAHPRALRPRRAPAQDPVRRSRGLSMRRQRMRLIILIIIILLLIGALPTWPYSSGW